MDTNRRRRAGAFLLGGAAGLGLLLSLLFPGVAPWSPASAAPAVAASCGVTHFALDPSNPSAANPAKEVPAAFGPAITVRGEAAVKAELNERRECGADGKFDPALTAAHYADWSDAGLTTRKVEFTGIDAFTAEIANNSGLYGQVISELKKLENESSYSEAPVQAGIWSLYMIPDGNGGVHVGQGHTSSAGTNAVFTHGDKVVRYRLDCGFQPNREGEYPGVPQCTAEQCPPPAPPVVTCPPGQVIAGDNQCHDEKWTQSSAQNEGWTQRGTDNGVTDGQESTRQEQSGQTRGNAVNDQVSSGTTSGSVTNDTASSTKGGPVATGAKPGGDDQSKGAVDTTTTNQDQGGTSGDTHIGAPAD